MRRLLLILSMAFLAWAAFVAATGGAQWRIAGVLFRSRDPGRALAIGLGLLVVQALVFRGSFTRDTTRVVDVVRPLLLPIAVCAALALGWHAIRYGSFTAGGADSFGYVSQAYGWADGTIARPQPFPFAVPWPSGDQSLAPLGYRPGLQPHTMVPTYAPGLPLMMAAALVFGSCGPFLVVPLCAAALVWLTFLLGRRIGGPWAGALAAVFAATSPIVLFQSMWPMSDVPAAALSAGAAVAATGGTRRSAAAAGVWTAAGLLVRPNLPIIPLVLLVYIAATSRGRERWIRIAWFCGCVVPVVLAVAALNTAWYGAPWNSGYGAARELYSLASIAPNLTRYPVWLWQSQSPLVLLAFVPLLPWMRAEVFQPGVRLLVVLFAATLMSYLVYFPFEEWWYLRFLLPAMPALFVLVSTGLVALGRRLPTAWGRVAVAAVAILVMGYTSRFNANHGSFADQRDNERRYADVGLYVRDNLPRNAVLFSVQESGSVRFYGGRMTIRWDLVDRDWTSRAAAEVERLGLHPYIVLEDFELPQMRDWFGLAANQPPPWPLVARMREHGGVSILDMSSRPTPPSPVALGSGASPRCAAQQPLTIDYQ